MRARLEEKENENEQTAEQKVEQYIKSLQLYEIQVKD